MALSASPDHALAPCAKLLAAAPRMIVDAGRLPGDDRTGRGETADRFGPLAFRRRAALLGCRAASSVLVAAALKSS